MAINDKRAEAARKLTQVQRKVARLRREKNVEINGTRYDVRVPREKLKRYNSAQLDAFIARANEFTSRRTQFVALSNNKPVPAAKAKALERRESLLQKRHEKIMKNIGGLEAPFTGMSIQEREQMRPTVRAGGEAFARTFEPVKTRLENIRSEEALEKLTKFRDKQLSPTYARERVNSARDQLDKMLTRTGQEFFKARFNRLSDEVFFMFWEYGPYAGDVSMIYEIMKTEGEQNDLSDSDRQLYEDLSVDINDALTWAESEAAREAAKQLTLGPRTTRRAPAGKRAQARRRASRRRGR